MVLAWLKYLSCEQAHYIIFKDINQEGTHSQRAFRFNKTDLKM